MRPPSTLSDPSPLVDAWTVLMVGAAPGLWAIRAVPLLMGARRPGVRMHGFKSAGRSDRTRAIEALELVERRLRISHPGLFQEIEVHWD